MVKISVCKTEFGEFESPCPLQKRENMKFYEHLATEINIRLMKGWAGFTSTDIKNMCKDFLIIAKVKVKCPGCHEVLLIDDEIMCPSCQILDTVCEALQKGEG